MIRLWLQQVYIGMLCSTMFLMAGVYGAVNVERVPKPCVRTFQNTRCWKVPSHLTSSRMQLR